MTMWCSQIQRIMITRTILLFSLLFLLNALTIHTCSLCNVHMATLENPVFKLTLHYAAPDQYPVQSSHAHILWNGAQVATLHPHSRQVLKFQGKVRVIEGPNTLTIKGGKDSKGIIIDNVALVREGNTDNIVSNGDFQKISQGAQKTKNTFLGWTGLPTSITTTEHHKKWTKSTAALIGSTPKQSLSQAYTFDRQFRFQTDSYYLFFQYVAQSQAELKSAGGKVTWNGQNFSIRPQDYQVHLFKKQLKALKNSINVLSFQGEGEADGLGLTISNVKLVPLGNSINIVLNGDFGMPIIKQKVQSFPYLPGWQKLNKQITLGKAAYFNKHWPHPTSQVLTLDNGENIQISQTFNINQNLQYLPKESPFFEITFNYAAIDKQTLKESTGQFLWDGDVIAQFTPENREVNTYQQKISIKPGANIFSFKAKQGSSIAIGNFQVKRVGLKDSISDNGDFQLPIYKDIIPGWSGKAEIFDSESLNQNWQNAKVAKLSSKHNHSLSQTIQIDKDFKFVTNNYHLQLEYAPTKEAELNIPLALLTWNGKDFPLIATHISVHTFKVVVKAVRGANLLTLEGQGKKGEGITIDNVKLTAFGSSSNSITNGDFQDRQIKGQQTKQTFYLISQWQGYNIQLGLGQSFNPKWKPTNLQVLSLATTHKTVISQILSLSEISTINAKEPKIFKLSFNYAAEDGKPLEKSGGEVFWNKVMTGDFVPPNYDINTYSLTLDAKKGHNQLFIKGAGGLQAYGVTVDNIKLVRQGSQVNLIENGDFESAPTPGWSSIIHHAPLVNHQWKKISVGHLDANNNLTLSKSLDFDGDFRYKTNKFNLVFQYAAKAGADLSKVEGTCRWNNLVFHLKPKDYTINHFKTEVTGTLGENILKFQGIGLTIDNVRLIPHGSISNVLSNGDFQAPQINSHISHHIPSGWNAQNIQFAKSYLFSTQWPYASGQTVSLIKRDKFLTQAVILNVFKEIVRPEFSFFKLSLDFIGLGDNDDQSGQVYWNNRLVGTLSAEADGANKFSTTVDAQSGKNVLAIKKKNSGVAVTNVKLIRYGLDENIVENGDFTAQLNKHGIPFWSGKASIGNSDDYAQDWQGSKVAVLDDSSGGSISQELHFDGNLRLLTKNFVLSFQHAVRQGVKFQTAKARVIWNNKVINFQPKDHKLHLYKEIVPGRVGNNNLIFKSNGIKTEQGVFAQGFNVDNVALRPYGSAKNVLINGGFEQPKVEGFDYGMFTKKVPGWITKDIYIGVGHFFGKFWGPTQIMELDASKQNAQIMQIIKLRKGWRVNQ